MTITADTPLTANDLAFQEARFRRAVGTDLRMVGGPRLSVRVFDLLRLVASIRCEIERSAMAQARVDEAIQETARLSEAYRTEVGRDDQSQANITALNTEIRECRELLAGIQWAGTHGECPSCHWGGSWHYEEPSRQHAGDCPLAAHLAPVTGAAESPSGG